MTIKKILLFTIVTIFFSIVVIGLTTNTKQKISTTKTTESKKNSNNYLPIKTDSNDIGYIANAKNKGWKKYTNKIANFSIKFPDYLNVIEEQLNNNDRVSGRILFCSHQIKKNINFCEDGLQILYGIPESDGWGGGCDPSYDEYIDFLGKKKRVCKTPNGISQIYISHKSQLTEFSISAVYTNKFDENDAIKMLSSFKLIETAF